METLEELRQRILRLEGIIKEEEEEKFEPLTEDDINEICSE